MLPLLPEDLLGILSPRLDATGVTDGGTRSSSSIGRIAGIEVIQSDTILVVLLAARSWRLGDLSSRYTTTGGFRERGHLPVGRFVGRAGGCHRSSYNSLSATGRRVMVSSSHSNIHEHSL